MSKFKVGDTVKIVRKHTGYGTALDVGDISTIAIDRGSEMICPYILSKEDGFFYREDQLELVSNLSFEGVKVGDTVKIENENNGIKTIAEITVDRVVKSSKTFHNAQGGFVNIYVDSVITLIDRVKTGPVGTVYSYASVKESFIEYYIVTDRGLIKAVNVSDPNAPIEKIPVAKLTKLPVEQ